jgi:hypothetical protein
LDRVWIWNYNEADGPPYTLRGAATTGTVETSLDNSIWTPLPSASNLVLTQAPGADGYDTPDVVPLGGTSAQYVRFLGLNSYPDAETFVGLAEVIFFESDPIPEPSTLVLAAIGLLGLLGWGRRRHR